jgi:hypothetical protein
VHAPRRGTRRTLSRAVVALAVAGLIAAAGLASLGSGRPLHVAGNSWGRALVVDPHGTWRSRWFEVAPDGDSWSRVVEVVPLGNSWS